MVTYMSREKIEEIRVRGQIQNTPNIGDFIVFNQILGGWYCRKDWGKMIFYDTFSNALKYMEIKVLEAKVREQNKNSIKN